MSHPSRTSLARAFSMAAPTLLATLLAAVSPLAAASNATNSATTRADLALNWAEAKLPGYLTSAQPSQTTTYQGVTYTYRGPYAQSAGNSYFLGVGTSASPPHAFMLDTGSSAGLVDLGLLSTWLSTMGVATQSTGTEISTCTASYILSGSSGEKASTSFTSTTTDTSAICAKSGADLTLTSPTITTSGGSSSLDNSSFYGLNAAVLALGGSNITIEGGTVQTSGSGANGVFATGVGTSISLRNLSISATGQGGHGVDATLGGALALSNVTARTTGANGSVIATDRGGGTITVSGGSFTAEGTDSAGVYATGMISAAHATITSKNAEAVVVEGGNTAILGDCTLTAAKGSRDRGMFVYQSTSGDASEGTGTLTLIGGSYTWPSTTGPAFYSTNATAIINLSGLNIQSSSPLLLKAAADSWGVSGKNGGKVTVNATAQTLVGQVVADSVSTIALNLTQGSQITGALNTAGTAGSMDITLDASSTWTVTADSHVTTLTETAGTTTATLSNIASNGYKVYYKSASNAWLGGKTVSLTGGGQLIPE